MGAFKAPHGGELKNLYLDAAAAEAEKQAAREYASWDLTERQLCDIELILNGDIFDFDAVTAVPSKDRHIEWLERSRGPPRAQHRQAQRAPRRRYPRRWSQRGRVPPAA